MRRSSTVGAYSSRRYGPGADGRADLLLQHEPSNMQAQSLRTLIERGVTRDGYIGGSRSPYESEGPADAVLGRRWDPRGRSGSRWNCPSKRVEEGEEVGREYGSKPVHELSRMIIFCHERDAVVPLMDVSPTAVLALDPGCPRRYPTARHHHHPDPRRCPQLRRRLNDAEAGGIRSCQTRTPYFYHLGDQGRIGLGTIVTGQSNRALGHAPLALELGCSTGKYALDNWSTIGRSATGEF